jgi:methionyl-tRNA formyltransferase
MRILWLGGNHPRHLHFAAAVQDSFELCGAVIQVREQIIPTPPAEIAKVDRSNFIRHFANRADAEERFFGEPQLPECQIFEVESDERLNSRETAGFIEQAQPELILIFGTGLLRDPLFSSLPCPALNLHLGLSPRYRGDATLFWPFYFLEPAYAGSTLHYIVSEPDAGDIVHQVVPELAPHDRIHDVACKTLVASAHEAVELLRILDRGEAWTAHKQRGTGRNFLSSDFQPQHLRVIYNLFDDDIVRRYLDGDLARKEPVLIRQFS